jgi:hypothetical protein
MLNNPLTEAVPDPMRGTSGYPGGLKLVKDETVPPC